MSGDTQSNGERLSDDDAATLRRVAFDAISYSHGPEQSQLTVDAASFSPSLQEIRSSFVTLYDGDELRGCMGRLEAAEPLVADVAHNAYNAAFRDPRFPEVTPEELSRLRIKVSVLSPSTPLEVASEAELLEYLATHHCGLTLRAEGRHSTFLPSVWESLPEPGDFLAKLKLKADLPADYWSEQIRFEKYTSEEYG